MPIELHPTEAEGYYLNLTSETPLVFVMWRPAEDEGEPAARPYIVTVSYNEAGRFMDGGERVDPVPMPDAIRAWIEPFVAAHYKPEPKRKVKRNDPFADGASARDRARPQVVARDGRRIQIAGALLAFALVAAQARGRARRRRAAPGDAPAPPAVPASRRHPSDAPRSRPFRAGRGTRRARCRRSTR